VDKIGIITITFNSANVLAGFLESIFSQSYKNFILYVIDNASEDDTINILKSLKDSRSKVIFNKKNLGVARANNIGITKAINDNCDQVLIINNDVEFKTNLINNLLITQSKFDCSLVAPKMKYFYDKNKIWYAGSWFKSLNGFLPLHRGMNQNDSKQYDQDELIHYAPTCCLLIKKIVFKDIGYMDEKYFVYFDDVDFLYRVYKQKHHKLYYCYNVDFYHKVGSLTSSIVENKKNIYRSDFFIKQNFKNHVYFLKKVGGIYSSFFIFLLFFKFNLRFVFSKRIRKNLSTFFLINKSYFSGLFMRK
tara:strand:+ start:90010 stop:90924 length:915 start_codon:yes stop_codon:yes gene_type:complete